jgi:hypothetical protein
MATVHETLQDLRSEYVSESTENLGHIDRLLRRLEGAADKAALEQLHRRFLGLAGSGYTYGFPLVSTLGRKGERICAPLLQPGQMVSPGRLVACRAVLDELRAEFDRLQAAYTAGPWARRVTAQPQAWAGALAS